MFFRKAWLTPKWTKAAVDSDPSDTTAATYFFRCPCDALLKYCTIIPGDALTADNTHYATITLEMADGAGGSATSVATINTKITGSGDWAAGVTKALTVTTNTLVKRGYVLGFKIAKAGSGVAVPALVFQASLWPRDGK